MPHLVVGGHILLLVKEFKIYVLKSTKIPIIFFHFLNVDSSFDIENRLLKFFVVVYGIIMEGTMSQIFFLGPSFCFMVCRNRIFTKFIKCFPIFTIIHKLGPT